MAIVVGMMLLGPAASLLLDPSRWRGCSGVRTATTQASASPPRWPTSCAGARFHFGDDSAPGGVCVLPAKVQQRIWQPTVTLRTSTFGDAIGFGWFLRWALWTGVVVVMFVRIVPEAKLRQLKGALDAHQAGLREQAAAGSDRLRASGQAEQPPRYPVT